MMYFCRIQIYLVYLCTKSIIPNIFQAANLSDLSIYEKYYSKYIPGCKSIWSIYVREVLFQIYSRLQIFLLGNHKDKTPCFENKQQLNCDGMLKDLPNGI